MGIPPSESKQLTLGEYQGLLYYWNKAQSGEEEPLEPPSIEETMKRRQRLEQRGIKVLH